MRVRTEVMKKKIEARNIMKDKKKSNPEFKSGGINKIAK